MGESGTTGQYEEKTFPTVSEAHVAASDAILERVKKGYVEISLPTPNSSEATERDVRSGWPNSEERL